MKFLPDTTRPHSFVSDAGRVEKKNGRWLAFCADGEQVSWEFMKRKTAEHWLSFKHLMDLDNIRAEEKGE